MLHGHLTLLTVGGAVAYHPSWIYAEAASVSNLPENPIVLMVYRSPLVRDTDSMYAPVARYLAGRQHRVESRKTYDDRWMMFGEGEWTIYQIATEGGDFVDIDPDIGEILQGRGEDIVRRLRATRGHDHEAVPA